MACNADGLVMSSHERKYLSFQLLACVLPVLCPAEVGVVLSPNLLVCLVNNSRSSGNYLYSIARHLVSPMCVSCSMRDTCKYTCTCTWTVGRTVFLCKDYQ